MQILKIEKGTYIETEITEIVFREQLAADNINAEDVLNKMSKYGWVDTPRACYYPFWFIDK